jgi:hypothetical protein
MSLQVKPNEWKWRESWFWQEAVVTWCACKSDLFKSNEKCWIHSIFLINDRLVWNLDSFGVMFKLAPSRSSTNQDSLGDWTSGPKL